LLRHGHGSYGLIVREHDVIAIRVAIDAGDPRRIWRAGKDDRGKQNQHSNDRKEGRDPPILEEVGLADRIGCCRHDSERSPRLPSTREQKRNVQGTGPSVSNRRQAGRRCKTPTRRSPSF